MNTVEGFIGERREEQLTCGTHHLPGVYNPGIDVTACLCGAAWWVGQVGTWHSVERRSPWRPPAWSDLSVGLGALGVADRAELLGWDTYYLHAPRCSKRPDRSPCFPSCGGFLGADYQDAIKAAAREASHDHHRLR